MSLSILDEYKKSQKQVSDKLFDDFKKQGFSPTRDRYEDIVSILKIEYGSRFEKYAELLKSVTDGIDDGGFDACVFTPRSLDLYDFKIGKGIKLSDVKKLNINLRKYFLDNSTDICGDTDKRLKQIVDGWRGSKRKEIINIVFVREAITEVTGDVQLEIKEIEKNHGVNVLYRGNDYFYEKLLDERYLDEWLLPKNSIEEMTECSEDIRVVSLPLSELLDLYKSHVTKERNLFAQNVRVPKKTVKFYSSLSKSVNKQPKNFIKFHNGIVVVCSKVGEDAKQYIIKRPQVVNGAQTIGSLYEEFKNNLTQQKLKDSKVLCKIIETTDQDLISHICETSNTQKAVALVDLRTNDLFQKELEHYFKIKGKYHYNRKGDKAPKEYKNLPYANFYQWCHSAFNEKPAEAKNAKNLLFSLDEHGQYEDLNRKISFNINHLTRLCDIAFVVNEYIRSDTSKTEKGLMRIMSLHIIAGMYYINSDTKTDFKKIYSILYKSYKKQVKSDENLDANKVFTKSEIAWNDLKIKLNSKYVTRKS